MDERKTLKPYTAARGLQMDAYFTTHAVGCPQCCRFNENKPATAALMCLEGSVLYKRDNAVVKREHVEKPDTFATKAEMKRATKYRE